MVSLELDRKSRLNSVLKEYELEIQSVFHALFSMEDYAHNKSIGFEYNDEMFITNPFLSECGFTEVNPVEYYGADFIESKVAEYILMYGEMLDKLKNRQ